MVEYGKNFIKFLIKCFGVWWEIWYTAIIRYILDRKGGIILTLKTILQDSTYTIIQGNRDILIQEIQYNSKNVGKGDLFVCVEGLQADGHQYVSMAIERGAVALICQKALTIEIPNNITVIQVADTRICMAEMSCVYYGNPSKEFALVGVTGTNGKTTITYLIESILRLYEKRVAVIGTIENRIQDTILQTERTTPDSKELQALFAQIKEADISHTVMEVSSHALDLHRVTGMYVDVAVFTNLTQDHLDYHKTIEAYREAKAKLFAMAKNCVINIDDSHGAYFLTKVQDEVYTYAIDKEADLKATNISFTPASTNFTLQYQGKSYEVALQTAGRFSVYNALGAIGACLFLDVPMKFILKGLAEQKGVLGRFQTIKTEQGIYGIVDYAHTPDGLLNILQTAKEFAKGRILLVFGCGGDRDKTKRPLMGAVAEKYADVVFVTSDNPRTEDPLKIMKEIIGEGLSCSYECVEHRREAIQKAVLQAEKEDVVIVAGKGHETYQIFKDETIHFDDMEELKEAFLK